MRQRSNFVWRGVGVALAVLLIGCGGSSSHTPEDAAASSESSAFSTSSASVSSTPISAALLPTDTYGLYVVLGRPGEKDLLLGNAQAEQALLTFVRDNGFNYLVFYDAFNRELLNDRSDAIASLISRAKAEYDVREVGVALGDKRGADLVVEYNSDRDANARIDVLNLEYEFWNQTPRDEAFAFSVDALSYFNDVGKTHSLLTETYIGWIEQHEGDALARVLDRVLVHYYRTTDVGNVDVGLERLEYLAAGRAGLSPLRFLPIFSSEGPENTLDLPFMGTWLETHPHEQAKETWATEYAALEADWTSALHHEGASWYVYDKFLDVRHTTSHITSHPESQSVCHNAAVTLSVSTSVNRADYCWMYQGACIVDSDTVQGATTSTLRLTNVTDEQRGNYYARVISRDASNPHSFASKTATVDVVSCP
jgi:hypothetical protein